MPLDSLKTPRHLDMQSEDGAQERRVAHAMLQLREIRDYLGADRLSAFQFFLERVLQEDVLNEVCDGNIQFGPLPSKPVMPSQKPLLGSGVNLSEILEEEGDPDMPDGENRASDRAQNAPGNGADHDQDVSENESVPEKDGADTGVGPDKDVPENGADGVEEDADAHNVDQLLGDELDRQVHRLTLSPTPQPLGKRKNHGRSSRPSKRTRV